MQTFQQYNESLTKATLEYHRVLNPKFWDGKELDSQVRTKLLQIARVWAKFANIDNNNIVDIILTGGNANYNYTRQSDLDVHLVIDYEKVSCEGELVMDYFMAKKALWAANHSNVKVLGYPVELFAEDKRAKHPQGQGVFSLLKNKWIQEPKFTKMNFSKNTLLLQKVEFYMKQIDTMVKSKNSVEAANELKDKIRSMRGASIQAGGEFSFENLVFKELRNRGYLDKLSNYLKKNQERELSLFKK